MGWLNRFFKKLSASNYGTPGARYTYYFGHSTAGKNVTDKNAMRITAVYACVRILSETLASLPLIMYKVDEDGNRVRALEHPLYNVLHNEPNSEMTSFSLRETLMAHLLLRGNAYAQLLFNNAGQVIGLYPLMPDKMEVERDPDGSLAYYYQYDIAETPYIRNGKSFVRLNPWEVLHIPGLGFDGLVGYSPIAMAKDAIGMSMAADEYGATFFANGASPGGILSHPGTIKDSEKVREAWEHKFGGPGSAHRVAVLEEGMKYQQIGIAPEQAQFLETRKFQINEIARIFRVPPHMLADLEKSSFSNIEQQSLEFVKYTMTPWVTRWEQALTRRLLRPDEKGAYEIRFNLEGLLRGDYQSRMNGYAIGRQNGWLSTNDIRRLEDMNLVPAEEGGDLYLINGNMLPLEMAGAYADTSTTKEDSENEEVLELEDQQLRRR